jgi:chorismate-pyruvate lyase
MHSCSIAGDPRRTIPADALFPLTDFYARAGRPLPRAELVAPGAVPEPFRSLLVHERDMTPTLESHYADDIHIEVLRSERRDDAYFREVILRLDRDDRPVGFGASKISLDLLAPPVRRLVLKERLPIGHILKAHKVPHSGQPSAFFRVAADSLIRTALRVNQDETLYGRRNTLRDGAGRSICEVVEILAAQ